MSSTLNQAEHSVTVTVKPLTQHPRQLTRFQEKKALLRLMLKGCQWGANWRHK